MNNAYRTLDHYAAPNRYTEPPTEEEIAYAVYFQKICQRYCIDFSKADEDERAFVVHMAEKGFYAKQA